MAKAQLELNLAQNVKTNKKRVFRYLSTKQNHGKDKGPLTNRTRTPVTYNAVKAEFLNSFFISVFGSVGRHQITGSSSYDNTYVDTPEPKKGLVCCIFLRLNPHQPMGLDGIHHSMLRKVADIIARPLPIIFEKSWRTVMTRREQMSYPSIIRAPKPTQKAAELFVFKAWQNSGMSPPRNCYKLNETGDWEKRTQIYHRQIMPA